MLKLSVIIPNFNRADALERTLIALGEQTISAEAFEAIVVDDGSSDDSVSRSAHLRLPYSLQIFQQSNGGAGAARNQGAQLAQADRFVFLDADMIAAPGLLQQYSVASTVHPQALVIGRQRPWVHAYSSLFDKVTRYERFRDFGPEQFDPVFYHVLSSSMSIRREDFQKVGGFDVRMGTGAHPAADDTDFGYRAQKVGISLVYWPDALAYHNHPRDFEQRCIQEYAQGMWAARLFDKHPEMRGSIPIYRDVQPISWLNDSPTMIARKVGKQLLVLKPVQSTLEWLLRSAEQWWPNPRLLGILYWRVLGTYRASGFRLGRNAGWDSI